MSLSLVATSIKSASRNCSGISAMWGYTTCYYPESHVRIYHVLLPRGPCEDIPRATTRRAMWGYTTCYYPEGHVRIYHVLLPRGPCEDIPRAITQREYMFYVFSDMEDIPRATTQREYMFCVFSEDIPRATTQREYMFCVFSDMEESCYIMGCYTHYVYPMICSHICR